MALCANEEGKYVPYKNREAVLTRDVHEHEVGVGISLSEGTRVYEYDGGRVRHGIVDMSLKQKDEDQGNFYFGIPLNALRWIDEQ